MSEPKAGDSVLYVPDACHWNDTDSRGQPLFSLVDAKTGQAVESVALPVRREEDCLRDDKGRALKIGAPLQFWPAVIKSVSPDGTAWLEIKHPRGLTYEYSGIKHSAGKLNHTWHVAGE